MQLEAEEARGVKGVRTTGVGSEHIATHPHARRTVGVVGAQQSVGVEACIGRNDRAAELVSVGVVLSTIVLGQRDAVDHDKALQRASIESAVVVAVQVAGQQRSHTEAKDVGVAAVLNVRCEVEHIDRRAAFRQRLDRSTAVTQQHQTIGASTQGAEVVAHIDHTSTQCIAVDRQQEEAGQRSTRNAAQFDELLAVVRARCVGVDLTQGELQAVGCAALVAVRVARTATARTGRRLVDIIRATVGAVRRAIVVRVRLGHTTATRTRRGLQRIARAAVVAVGCAIVVRVRIGHATAALTGRRLVRVVRAQVVAVRGTIAIRVHIGHATTTRTGRDLQRIVRATVEAVRCAVIVRVGIGDAAATRTGSRLQGVARATIDAVHGAIVVAVGFRHAAAASTGSRLQRVIRATIKAVERAVVVGIAALGHTATTCTGSRLERVVRAAVHTVRRAVVVAVGVRGIRRAHVHLAGVGREVRIAETVTIGVRARVARGG